MGKNKEIIPLEKLLSFAKFFNVSIDYLLGLSKEQSYMHNFEINRKIVGELFQHMKVVKH